MTIQTILGIALIIAIVIGSGIYSGKKVKNASDFLGSGKAGPWLVCGTIMGSLVSSQATIGTAQLAFNYGLAAWWFTLGSGLGCLILAIIYAIPLRHSNCITELQIISKEYGIKSGSLGSLLCSVGIFISILAQVVACSGMITVLMPGCALAIAVIAGILLMCIYVIFGGVWGAGMGGVIKLILLCIASVVCMVFVLVNQGGIAGIQYGLNDALINSPLGSIQPEVGLSAISTSGDIQHRFFNLTARGTMKDIGSGISLLLGVLSTQTYAQAIWSAETDGKAKQGALFSAFLIPPIGIAGICIGLYMRCHYITQAEVDALISAGQTVPDMPVLGGTIQVFPTFVIDHMPPLFAGIILGTLLITVVGGGAGLSLGMATIILKDIYKRITGKLDTPAKELMAVRTTIGAILTIAAIIAIIVPGRTINDLGFLSMGLRGAVVFLPMTFALWCKGKVNYKFITASMVLGPFTILAAKLLKLPVDALFPGMGAALICCVLGILLNKKDAS